MWNSIRFGNTIRETTPQWELLVQTGDYTNYALGPLPGAGF